jgi:hypothetical protein
MRLMFTENWRIKIKAPQGLLVLLSIRGMILKQNPRKSLSWKDLEWFKTTMPKMKVSHGLF